MTDYKIHPIRFAGRIQPYVVTIFRKDYIHSVNNSNYPDFKSEKEVFEYFESIGL